MARAKLDYLTLALMFPNMYKHAPGMTTLLTFKLVVIVRPNDRLSLLTVQCDVLTVAQFPSSIIEGFCRRGANAVRMDIWQRTEFSKIVPEEGR